ncbi:SET domain-containing protein [Coprinopsis marcescibilis]|uniref:SET domain-containing protein n=1 Tax=Coprinopsis marcescibilis TaxID=230819 RepID=A0A5C3LC21_COPMA|nr:SET domain-containing protein [Coprinopsis marcescibilis]
MDIDKPISSTNLPQSATIPSPEISVSHESTTVLPTNGLYAALPTTLQIHVSPETGRGLYSTTVYKPGKYLTLPPFRQTRHLICLVYPGDVLFAIKPHVSTLSTAHLDSYCSSCFAPGKSDNDDGRSAPLKRCTNCKTVVYCDAKCQSKDWSIHKSECAALRRWFTKPPGGPPTEEPGPPLPSSSSSSSSPPLSTTSEDDSDVQIQPPNDAIRALGRILWRKQKLGKDNVWVKEIESLQSHRTDISKDPTSSDSELYARLAHSLIHYLGVTSPQELGTYGINSAADLLDLVSRFITNTFAITTPTLTPIGACVSPLVALINHSCDPNAVVVFPRGGGEKRREHEPLMEVVAIKEIRPGDQIFTSYIDTTLPRSLRRKVLKETYHFICKCPLCLPPTPTSSSPPIDMREAMYCPKKCSGYCLLPTEEDTFTRCTKCKAVVRDTDAVLDALRIGQEALEKAERVQDSDPRKALQLTTNLIPILVSIGLVPGAHPLLALTRLHTSFLIAQFSTYASRAHAHGEGEGDAVEEILSPQLQSHTASTPGTGGTDQNLKEAQDLLDDAIRFATRVTTGLGQVLSYGHPVRGVALAELGKLLSVDEPVPGEHHIHVPSLGNSHAHAPTPTPASSSPTLRPPPSSYPPPPSSYPPSGAPRLKIALDTLLRARAELLIGFGGDGEAEIVQGVRAQVVDLERELEVWRSGIRDAVRDLKVERGVRG